MEEEYFDSEEEFIQYLMHRIEALENELNKTKQNG